VPHSRKRPRRKAGGSSAVRGKAMGNKRRAIPMDAKHTVLHEAGYKCGNPVCRNLITLDIHHLIKVSESGPDSAENLLPLCPNCHALHHIGKIPATSLRTWKMLLLALNEAFDRKSVDILLALDTLGKIERITGDGVCDLAPLVAAGVVKIQQGLHTISFGMQQANQIMYSAELSEKGKLLVESWKIGDQSAAIGSM
jgi:hypothetical protein